MNTPAPDYGEPWKKRAEWLNCPFCNREGAIIDLELDRILACVNALAGVQDPAAHLASLNAAIERYEETLRVMNDALKEASRIFGNIGNSQVIQHLCPDFADVAEQVKKAHDPHA